VVVKRVLNTKVKVKLQEVVTVNEMKVDLSMIACGR
jgi:hypothetical protein